MVTCARCGQENPEGARFCNSCGAPLEAAEETRLEERKVVTVLFADLVGFTSRAEQMDPEEVRALLRPYHARLRDELERFGGTVEKFIGDAVMAVFGAPVAHEDDAERAVRAGLAIRDWILDEQAELQLRIGVNTGQALVSLGARPEEGEGMVAGDVVNTAARLQSNAPVNGILVGETTWRATHDAIDYREAEPVQAKGKSDPVDVWEAIEARGRVGVDISGRVRTPLVGRRRELDTLLDAFERVRSGRSAQLVTLVGEPGIGKSRLVYELFQTVERDPELVYWRQGRSLPYGEGISFWALGEMVKAHAGILETDTEDEAQRKLHDDRRADGSAADDVEWTLTHLRPLAGVEDAAQRSGSQDEAFTAWRRLPRGDRRREHARARVRGPALGRRGLLDFVDHLVDWATRVPLLVVGTARPELLARRPGWGGGKTNALTLSPAPLSRTRRRSSSMRCSSAPRSPPMSRQRCSSAPAATRSTPRSSYASSTSARRAQALPETVQGIIAARLDVLDREEKELLQDAAVLGRVFWVGGLGHDREAAEAALHRLERREFVQRERRSTVAGRDGVRVPPCARSRGRVRADPARPAWREAPTRRRLARDARPSGGSRPSCSRTTTLRCSSTRSRTPSSPQRAARALAEAGDPRARTQRIHSRCRLLSPRARARGR